MKCSGDGVRIDPMRRSERFDRAVSVSIRTRVIRPSEIHMMRTRRDTNPGREGRLRVHSTREPRRAALVDDPFPSVALGEVPRLFNIATTGISQTTGVFVDRGPRAVPDERPIVRRSSSVHLGQADRMQRTRDDGSNPRGRASSAPVGDELALHLWTEGLGLALGGAPDHRDQRLGWVDEVTMLCRCNKHLRLPVRRARVPERLSIARTATAMPGSCIRRCLRTRSARRPPSGGRWDHTGANPR
jgi:hypothetical protein